MPCSRWPSGLVTRCRGRDVRERRGCRDAADHAGMRPELGARDGLTRHHHVPLPGSGRRPRVTAVRVVRPDIIDYSQVRELDKSSGKIQAGLPIGEAWHIHPFAG